MLVSILLFVAGLVLLVGGAELLIRGASRLALRVGIPSLVVGLTVVAYGTSTPEVVVSAKAALAGQGGLALGNVVGSNIFNVLFILGASALIRPLVVTRAIIWREVPVAIGVSLLAWVMSIDGRVSRVDGTILLVLLVIYTVYQVWSGLKEGNGVDTAKEKTGSVGVNITFILSGLAVLVWGAQWLLSGAVDLARGLGMSELVIGLTLVAAGTSLPEVATSVLATVRGQREIAIGNVVGSNIYNILAVLGAAAVLAPRGVEVAPAALNFDIPIMVAVAAACLPIFLTDHSIARWEGALFLFYYGAYTVYLVLAATQHDGLSGFSSVLWFGVIPLTVVTLGVSVAHHVRAKGPHGH